MRRNASKVSHNDRFLGIIFSGNRKKMLPLQQCIEMSPTLSGQPLANGRKGN